MMTKTNRHAATKRRATTMTLVAATTAALFAVAPAAQAQQKGRLDDLLGGIFGAGRSGSGRSQSGESTTTQGASRFLRASIATDRTQYGSDRAVAITLTLTNIGDQRIEVRDVPEYDIWVRESRGGGVLWQSSRDGQQSGRRRTTFRVEPGQTRTYRELWDQRDGNGRRLRGAGTYRIEARISPQELVATQIYLSDRDAPRDDDRYDRDGRPLPPRDDRYDRDQRDQSTNVRSELRLEPSSGTIRAGDTATLNYSIVNTDRSRSRMFRFSSGRQFDAYAVAPRARVGGGRGGRGMENNRVAWRHGADMFYTQALGQFTLGPNERRTFTARWRTPRDLDNGAYQIVAFLTPMDASGSGRGRDTEGAYQATAMLRVEGGYGSGSGSGDRRGGLGDRANDGDEYGSVASVRLRDLDRNGGRDYLNRRIVVSGTYRGANPSGYRSAPVRGTAWVIEDGGTALYAVGAPPSSNLRSGDRVTVVGTLRRTEDGRYYLEADRYSDRNR